MFVREKLGGEFSGRTIVDAFLKAISHRKEFNETGTRWEGNKAKVPRGIKVELVCRDSKVDPESLAYRFSLFPINPEGLHSEIQIGIFVPPGCIEDKYFSTNAIRYLLQMLSKGRKTSGVEYLDDVWKTYQVFLTRLHEELARA